MQFGNNLENKSDLHPYLFVLKEGEQFSKNFLDYSLHILQIGPPEYLGENKEPTPRLYIPRPNIYTN